MKKPAIIDPTIEVRIYSRAMLIPPHKMEEFEQEEETEVLYARAMELISDGKPLEGREYLEEAYDLGSFGKPFHMVSLQDGSVYKITRPVSLFSGTLWRGGTLVPVQSTTWPVAIGKVVG